MKNVSGVIGVKSKAWGIESHTELTPTNTVRRAEKAEMDSYMNA